MGMFNDVQINGWGFIPDLGWQTKSDDIVDLSLCLITIHTDGSLSYEGGMNEYPPTFWQGTGELEIHCDRQWDGPIDVRGLPTKCQWVSYSFNYKEGTLQSIYLNQDGYEPLDVPELLIDLSLAYLDEV